MCSALGHVRFVPIADIPIFIRSPHRRAAACEWHVKTERLCGFEVDDQIELGWCLHGQVLRLGTFENAVDIRRCLGKLFGEIVGISNQTASLSVFAPIIHRRYAVAGRQQSDVFAICRVEKGVGYYNETSP